VCVSAAGVRGRWCFTKLRFRGRLVGTAVYADTEAGKGDGTRMRRSRALANAQANAARTDFVCPDAQPAWRLCPLSTASSRPLWSTSRCTSVQKAVHRNATSGLGAGNRTFAPAADAPAALLALGFVLLRASGIRRSTARSKCRSLTCTTGIGIGRDRPA
jgi:hypothetical protein